jgi:integrase
VKQKNSSITIRPFTNPSGVIVYQVDGTIAGKRIRKNFPSKKEAQAEKSALEMQFLQACDANLRMVTTFLSADELREAEAVFRQLKESKQAKNADKPLSFYVTYALANYRPPNCIKPLADAAESYRLQREADYAKGLISKPQYNTIRKYLVTLVQKFPGCAVSDLSGEKLKALFESGGASLKTFNNRRGIVSTFLIFARGKDWIATDPLEKVPAYRISRKQRGTAPTLTAEKAAALMDYVEQYRNGAFVPFFALCLFAGIRPDSEVGEISKLTPETINMETGVIHVEPSMSKVNMRRNVTIQSNLAAWLRAYPLEKFPVLAPNIKQERTRIAKMFGLSHDVLRHTFISMHVGKYRSLGDAALEAGNSEEIIRKHYLDVKGKAEAEAFFSIMPKRHTASETLATKGAREELVTLPSQAKGFEATHRFAA